MTTKTLTEVIPNKSKEYVIRRRRDSFGVKRSGSCVLKTLKISYEVN